MDPTPARSVDAVDGAVFLAELALLAVLAVAGARLGHGSLGVALAVILPLAAAVFWGRLLAPRASRRLSHPERLVVKLVLFVVAAALLGISGSPLWGALFLAVSAVLVTAGELREWTADLQA